MLLWACLYTCPRPPKQSNNNARVSPWNFLALWKWKWPRHGVIDILSFSRPCKAIFQRNSKSHLERGRDPMLFTNSLSAVRCPPPGGPWWHVSRYTWKFLKVGWLGSACIWSHSLGNVPKEAWSLESLLARCRQKKKKKGGVIQFGLKPFVF